MARRFSSKALKTLRKLLPFKKPTGGSLNGTVTTKPAPIAVKRDTRIYLEQQGWTLANGSWPPTWHGYYRTKVGSWKGMIKTTTPPEFYIYKPPEGLTSKHSHKRCFHPKPDGWCWVHWNTSLRDLDSAVIKLERILYEAYVLTTQKSA